MTLTRAALKLGAIVRWHKGITYKQALEILRPLDFWAYWQLDNWGRRYLPSRVWDGR